MSDPDSWQVLVLKPSRLLVILNGIAASGSIVLGLYWTWFFPASIEWSQRMLMVGGFLSLVSFAGGYLNRR